MDDLRERLDRLRGLTLSIRDQLERLDKRAPEKIGGKGGRDRVQSLDEVLGGKETVTPWGSCYEVLSSYRSSFRHGQYPLGDFCAVDLGRIHTLCVGNGRAPVRAEEILFLDMETTGLSMGTGTYAFLLGLGFFRDGRYLLHQLFLRDFREEQAFLRRAGEIMEPFQAIVSFNGKRFDLPLLETRLILSGLPVHHRDKVLWDLLYPARRVWRDRLEDCRLGTIETGRLGVIREDREVRGEEIPAIYYRYIHSGETRDLGRIVYHNALDVLSLTTLVTHLEQSIRNKDPFDVNVLSLGRFYERQGMQETGLECYKIASGPGSSIRERDLALFQLALRMKRLGKGEEAVPIWQELIRRGESLVVECCLEMAKHYEHRAKEVDLAIQAVEFALVRARGGRASVEADLRRRLERLTRKRGAAWEG